MSYKIIPIPIFQRQAKRLSKKFASLKNELIRLKESLSQNPKQGKSIGNNCYKIRITIKSKGKGKRSGGRIITHVHITNEAVYLLAIYDKSEKEDLTDKEVKKLLSLIIK